MKLFKKITIHEFTIVLFLIGFLTGYAKYLFFIFLIIMIHELGHITISLIFKRKIVSVSILPFGGLIKTSSPISTDIFEDLLIAAGGFLFQLILGLILIFLDYNSVLNPRYIKFLSSYNILILSFNLLPICPLDGYKIIKLLGELFFPYKKTLKMIPIINIVTSCILFILKFDVIKSNMFTTIFLLFMFIEEIKSQKYLLSRFYLERSLWRFHYPRKNIETIDKMYKNRTNYVNGIHESNILKSMFTKK